MDRVQELLFVERDPRDVDGLEPFADLALAALAHVHREFRVKDAALEVGGERGEVLRHAVRVRDSELAAHIPTEARDPLLAVQNLVVPVLRLDEIEESERITLQERFDYRYVALAVGVDVVALIFWLDDELPAPAEETLALKLVVDEPVADVRNREICQQRSCHGWLVFRVCVCFSRKGRKGRKVSFRPPCADDNAVVQAMILLLANF